MQIRPATVADLDTILHHRRAMFEDMGHRDEYILDDMIRKSRPWIETRMRDNEYLGWFAEAEDRSIASGLGLWLMDWLPHVIAGGRWRGNIVNVYTEPSHRRQGLARALMQVALDWCAANEIGAIILHASDEGRPLYESLGFTPTNEMRLIKSFCRPDF